jgi:hypothetical protein
MAEGELRAGQGNSGKEFRPMGEAIDRDRAWSCSSGGGGALWANVGALDRVGLARHSAGVASKRDRRARKKLELDELARARSSSARLGPARRSERARAEPIFVAREKSEPARLGSVQLASWLVARPNNNLLHKILITI